MKTFLKYFQQILGLIGICLIMSLQLSAQDNAVDSVQAALKANKKAVKNTFDANFLIDNQTVMVPVKGTFEFDFQHRFGLITNGIKDLFGLYGGATIRLGFSYVPIKNLQVGFGSISDPMQVDFNAKYSIFRQTKDNSMPVSVTWYSNAVVDTRSADFFVNGGDRFSFFHQVIIAKKISDKLSVQISPNVSHYNSVPGKQFVEKGPVYAMNNTHYAIAFSARYKISSGTGIIVNYDQPLTQHLISNPRPNISFGLEMVTSAHVFQVFFGNYSYIVPQRNNFFNQNDFTNGQYLIGFNISRLWNF